MWQGKPLSIHTTAQARAAMIGHDTVDLIAGVGIAGDRYAKGIDTGTYSTQPDIRNVTLIEVETLEALARDHDITLGPQEHRRTLTTRDGPLNHLVGKRFRVGQVVLEGGRLNSPCRYIDMTTGKTICDLLEHRSGHTRRSCVQITTATRDSGAQGWNVPCPSPWARMSGLARVRSSCRE